MVTAATQTLGGYLRMGTLLLTMRSKIYHDRKTLHGRPTCHERRDFIFGAGNEIRTRDSKLGKLVLYQLSYARLPSAIK